MIGNMFTGCIYKITNNINGMIYIGQTIQDIRVRFRNHCSTKSHCKYLSNAIILYGKNNFSVESIISLKANTEEELRDLLNTQETKLIKNLNTLTPNGYNLTNGGDCAKMSRETVLANAEKHKKPIKCNETGREWNSIQEAAVFFGTKNESIHRVLRGVRKHFKNLTFSYILSQS